MKPLLSIILLILIFNSVIIAQKWQNVSPAGYNYFSTASFINDKEGWICARYGEWPNLHHDLVHTTNSAFTFAPIFTFPDNLIAWYLQMVDSLNGFAIIEAQSGNGNYFWSTQNGGNSWIDHTDSTMFKPNGPFDSSYGCFFLNSNIGFAGGLNSIYKTFNGGLTWVKTVTPTIIDSVSSNIYTPNKIFFYNDLYGWAACSLLWDAGFVLKTTDGGENWTACKPITGDLYNIHFADTLHGGTTGGSWFYAIVMMTENNFDTISHFYQNNWTQLPDAIYYQNDTTIWMSGWPAVIYKSTDGGTSFIEYDTSFATDNQTDWIHEFQFFDSTGYAFANSFLLKLVDTLHTDLIEQKTTINNVIIKPNPASKTCSVSLESNIEANSTIEIYSINGNLIYQREQFINTGNNVFLLDISDLVPGIYLLSIKNKSNMYFSRLIKQP